MKAVILDADTMGSDINWEPIANAVTTLNIYDRTSPAELLDRVKDIDLVITNKVVISAAVMENLKGIFVLATGTNNIDLVEARQRNIPVFNVANYGTQSVAQHTLMLILALAARLPLYQRDIAKGAWNLSKNFCLMTHATSELFGKKLVIVGQGTLGKAVAKLAEAFGVSVVFTARPGTAESRRPSFNEAIKTADIISFHCPLTDDTHHLLNKENIHLLKRDCLVVNCSRGGVIDEIIVLNALVQKNIAGLAVDVLPVEPPSNGHPLLDALDVSCVPLNLIVTPHNAWISPEARQTIVNLTAANIHDLVNSHS
jgi:glycerate dehydrogenase